MHSSNWCYYPTKASAIVNELYITAGKNHLYAAQGRVSTNDLARRRGLFLRRTPRFPMSTTTRSRTANGTT